MLKNTLTQIIKLSNFDNNYNYNASINANPKNLFINNKDHIAKPFFITSNNKKYSFSQNIIKQAIDQLLAHPYSRLMRWEKPIGALLLFWPCLWGI